ncbi:hypothetical protein OHS70_32990 [Streptomyces sp. NBC_00390]|uniref:hypothetical protein n=1 Tax=Streptomyces sp. NBC_00390 TaxID=2975736 RepID=UPI002E20D75A
MAGHLGEFLLGCEGDIGGRLPVSDLRVRMRPTGERIGARTSAARSDDRAPVERAIALE